MGLSGCSALTLVDTLHPCTLPATVKLAPSWAKLPVSFLGGRVQSARGRGGFFGGMVQVVF